MVVVATTVYSGGNDTPAKWESDPLLFARRSRAPKNAARCAMHELSFPPRRRRRDRKKERKNARCQPKNSHPRRASTILRQSPRCRDHTHEHAAQKWSYTRGKTGTRLWCRVTASARSLRERRKMVATRKTSAWGKCQSVSRRLSCLLDYTRSWGRPHTNPVASHTPRCVFPRSPSTQYYTYLGRQSNTRRTRELSYTTIRLLAHSDGSGRYALPSESRLSLSPPRQKIKSHEST